MKQKYLIEYTWGYTMCQHEEQEIETDDIDWTLDQIGRHRGGIQFLKVQKL
jgi:hypothetical protein|tara:strand:+ start:3567 stop:3719 length:153 start_codon:yes stop_codon:yes gene_type:complete